MAEDRVKARLADLVEDGSAEDVAFVERLVASFVERAPNLIRHIDDAIEAGDHGQTAERAHALKGAASNVGADRMAALAADAQHRAEAGELTDLVERAAELTAAFAAVQVDLAAALADLRTFVTSEP